jgi:hypothetical protein
MWLRSVLVWLLIAVAESVHGILRIVYLQPRLGDLPARQMSLVSGALIIVVIATLTIRWIGATSVRQQMAIGVLWLALTIAFDIAVGRSVFGYSWERIGADFNPVTGGYLGMAMLVLLVAPWLAAGLRGQR